MTNLFKPAKSVGQNYSPPGFNAGGLSSTFVANGPYGLYNGVNASGPRTDLVSGLQDASGQEADVYGGLRDTVTPGFNSLLDARLNQINDASRSAIGDLRTNLQSRRILGSSFGNDTISRTNAEFSRLRDNAIADNFLKSLDVNTQLTAKEFAARRQQFQSGLDELNLEANLAKDLTLGANTQLAANARTQAEIDQKTSSSTANFFSGVLGKVGGSLFGPTIGGAGNALASGLGF